MADLERMIADMEAEGRELDGIVAPLPAEEWTRDTPAAGWTIGHQIGHLTWTDEMSLIAVTRPDDFAGIIEQVLSRPDLSYVDEVAGELAALGPSALLARWRQGRARLAEALAGVPRGARLPWFGVAFSAPSMATARIMETWAHGQDIVDALGIRRTPGARLRYVAHIGVRARDFAFRANRLDPPAEEFRVELTAPDGATWTWGPEDAEQRVTGTALDFCLLVTQRRHRDDVDVQAQGADAGRWLTIAQAFAGPPGGGRRPGQFG